MDLITNFQVTYVIDVSFLLSPQVVGLSNCNEWSRKHFYAIVTRVLWNSVFMFPFLTHDHVHKSCSTFLTLISMYPHLFSDSHLVPMTYAQQAVPTYGRQDASNLGRLKVTICQVSYN